MLINLCCQWCHLVELSIKLFHLSQIFPHGHTHILRDDACADNNDNDDNDDNGDNYDNDDNDTKTSLTATRTS